MRCVPSAYVGLQQLSALHFLNNIYAVHSLTFSAFGALAGRVLVLSLFLILGPENIFFFCRGVIKEPFNSHIHKEYSN